MVWDWAGAVSQHSLLMKFYVSTSFTFGDNSLLPRGKSAPNHGFGKLQTQRHLGGMALTVLVASYSQTIIRLEYSNTGLDIFHTPAIQAEGKLPASADIFSICPKGFENLGSTGIYFYVNGLPFGSECLELAHFYSAFSNYVDQLRTPTTTCNGSRTDLQVTFAGLFSCCSSLW